MGLSGSEAVLVLAGCIIAIGAVWVLFKRGVFGGGQAAGPNTPEKVAKS